MKLILDTNVVVAGVRSRTGASNALLIAGFRNGFEWCCSVPLFYEYEDVLNRAEFLLDTGLTRQLIGEFLQDIASVVTPVGVDFRWRPQLNDPNDEMVLEAAINCGAGIVTHNWRDFRDVPSRFGLDLMTPAETLKRITP
jgi:putative PIN family toxin of toxin-antitoxin system